MGLSAILVNLFTYIEHANISRSTNHIEGSLNSRLKELLYRHRDLALNQKQTLVATSRIQKYFLAPTRIFT